jgi:3-methyladenine DNA glycosylase AlkD
MHADVAVSGRVNDALSLLRQKTTRHDLANLAKFRIAATKPLGVSMANIQVVAKRVGRGHGLALALWDTGVYEARVLASLVDEPEKVTVAQMDRWCRDFDNWGICDTVCFKLFDRSPHAWSALATARDLAASADASERWVGKDAVRDLSRSLVTRRFTPRAAR